MMKLLTRAVLLIFILSACNNAGSVTPAKEAENDAAANPAPPAGKLYLRTFYWAMSNMLEVNWIYLGKDGTIVKDPKHGTAPLDPAKEKRDNPAKTGTYTLTGDRMNITWSNGKEENWEAIKKDGIFTSLNGGVVSLADPLPPGYRMALVYPAKTFFDGASSASRITFTRDGRLRFSGSNDHPAIANGTGGNYTIRGNTLVLEFDGGVIARANICLLDEGPDHSRELVVNNTFEEL